MKLSLAGFCAAAMLTAAAVSSADEEAPLTVSVKRLSMEAALAVAQATIDACRKQGIQIGVTVVDRDGTVQAVLRDSIAPPITLSISRQKAFTAVNFGVATSALAARANTAIGRLDGLVMSAGGVPIQAGGRMLGGVGVSGAPSGETDEACAEAGVEAVSDDLEMSM